VDPQPPPGSSDPTPPGNGSAPHYRLPDPLRHGGGLPVAPSAPRIPRALRAFNGMAPPPPEPVPPTPVPSTGPTGARGRPREAPLTIRDLLEEPDSAAVVEEGRLAALRSALGRLRRGAGGRAEG